MESDKRLQFSFGTKICFVIFLLLAIKTGSVFLTGKVENFRLINDDMVENDVAKIKELGEESNEKIVIQHEYREEPLISVLITDSSGVALHKTLQLRGTKDFAICSVEGIDYYPSNETVDLEDYFSERKIDSCIVTLSSIDNEANVSVSGRAGSTETFSGQIYRITDSEKEATVEGIQLLSVKKGGISPVYPGSLKVFRSEGNGAFYLINELGLESYLPGVVSSEMPDQFGLEALKAQAVCARSYAMYVLEKEEMEQAENGAVTWNVVDTTDDQVYLSGAVDAQAVTACEQTRGQILLQEGSVMKPHYYSTSWGQKADGAVFSGEDTEFLKAAAIAETETDIQEIQKINTDFINIYEALSTGQLGNLPAYDYESPWFRWTCRISLSQLSDKEIKDLMVTKRGTGGYVSGLTVFYADGTAEQITGAKSIRKELGSPESTYYLQDGSTRKGLSILPSAFFYLDPVETADGAKMVTMHGGGFGHGFGMSQYGAAQMAEEGQRYSEILAYYFEQADICEYY